MITYFVRRFGYAVILLVLVSFVSFIIIDLPPGDYMDQKLAELAQRGDRSAEQRIEEYRAKYGLDKPFAVVELDASARPGIALTSRFSISVLSLFISSISLSSNSVIWGISEVKAWMAGLMVGTFSSRKSLKSCKTSLSS